MTFSFSQFSRSGRGAKADLMILFMR